MTLNKYIYKIDHYFNINHDESAFFLETTLIEEEMIDVLATIQFKFEDLVDESGSIENKSMIKILEKFYPIKHVSEEYKQYLPQTQLDEKEWGLINYFTVEKSISFPEMMEDFIIIQIDLYAAREYSCGDKYRELMLQELPNSKDYIDEILGANYE